MRASISLLKQRTTHLWLLAALALLWHSSAFSGFNSPPFRPAPVFDDGYTGAPPVAVDQAQVIFYRLGEGVLPQGAAHVYINQRFHTGLLPGGYSQFCLVPGTHTLGAYLNDSPAYHGKRFDLYQATFAGGKTYFLRVRENGPAAPDVVSREVAEKELASTRAQVHVLSRVSQMEACRYYSYLQPEQALPAEQLNRDIYFAFNQDQRNGITQAGHNALAQLLEQLQQSKAQIKEIRITGHTDPLSLPRDNEVIALRRANTVRDLLVEGGVPIAVIQTDSAGHREPRVNTCYGSRAEQIACYAPNRRATIKMTLK